MNLIEQLLAQTTEPEITNWINTTLKAYLNKETSVDQTEVEHIVDYLNSDKAPRRLQKMSYAQAKVAADKWTKALQKKGNNIVETEEDVEVILKSKKTGFKFVKLVGKAAFKREGAAMRHCVASYYGKQNVEIYSLRDAKNEPHCTIEVVKNGETGSINQIKGKGNGSIHPNYIKYVLKILKYFKMEIRDSELENLGYINLSEEYWKLMEQCYTGIKYMNFGGKKYFYSNSKLTPLGQ